MKESRHVKSKIFAGYTILILACMLTVGYVYREVVRFTASNGSYSLLQAKRRLVNRTLYHLYQAESYGQLMIAGYRSYDNLYRNELRTVRSHLDSLRFFSDSEDSLQTMRLDSITRLIADKERRTMSLRQSIRSAGTANLLEKNIEAIIGATDSTATALPTPVIQQDTLHVPKRKRRFFRRLADIFSPPKEDSSIVISREVTRPPSYAGPNDRDTIAALLLSLQDRVTNQRMDIYDRAWDEGARLRYSNHLINEKIYRLIEDFEAEGTRLLLHRIEQTDAMKRRSSRILGTITISAVMLMMCFVVILWRDINRSNRYKRELERANREKETLLRAREQLMLAITHDIKAPLGSIIGYIDLLTRLIGEKRPRLYLQNMKNSADHLLALVGSLLDFYRLDANKIDLRVVTFRPSELFETIRAGFAPTAEEKGLALRTEIASSAACEVAGDAFRIRQIADNLLSNALKFTDRGGVTLRAGIEDGSLIFSVRDTGRGIRKEEQERIFGEFVRLHSAQGVEGFGLGLSIVDRLVKLLGGRIWFESRIGEGTRFSVCIPVETAVTNRESLSIAPMQGYSILLVDDDPLQLEMTAAMCREAGLEAACCQYPEYAAKLAEERTFDLVLTDIQMPSTDGFGVLEAIRTAHPDLPVVAVTARSDNAAEEFIARGFAAVLRKPFSAGELFRAIHTACTRSGTAPHTTDDSPLTVSAIPGPGSSATAPAASGKHSGTDFAPLTVYAGEDAEAACRILESFAEQTSGNSRTLCEALSRGDEAAVKAVAHKMLPIFTLLGAAEITATLREAESGGTLSEARRAALLKMLERIDDIVSEAQKQLSLWQR